jgi:hypothetical protein
MTFANKSAANAAKLIFMGRYSPVPVVNNVAVISPAFSEQSCFPSSSYGEARTPSRAHAPCPRHSIETTARPFLPHPLHRSRPLRSRTLAAGLRPTFIRASGVSSATWWQAAQSTLTKSPDQDPSLLPKKPARKRRSVDADRGTVLTGI